MSDVVRKGVVSGQRQLVTILCCKEWQCTHWWIQDLPDGGRRPVILEQKSIIWRDLFLKTAWKWKKLDLEGCVSSSLLGSATGSVLVSFTSALASIESVVVNGVVFVDLALFFKWPRTLRGAGYLLRTVDLFFDLSFPFPQVDLHWPVSFWLCCSPVIVLCWKRSK